jgi:predicted nucleic acid-binding protein
LRLVVDASVLVELILARSLPGHVHEAVHAPGAALHVPALCDLEVASALRKSLHSGDLTIERALGALEDYVDLPLERHGHQLLLERVLALRHEFTAYDASYVALTEQMDASLVTLDRRMAVSAERYVKVLAP